MHTAALAAMPCCVCGVHGVQVHHRTGAGMGLRAHDHQAMPLCPEHHRALHEEWPREKRRAFEAVQVQRYAPGCCQTVHEADSPW